MLSVTLQPTRTFNTGAENMSSVSGGRWLTSKEAARLLGVSEASIKRWANSGLLPSEKTAGGHRRFRPEDVAVFRRGRGHSTERRATATVVQLQERRKAESRATGGHRVSYQVLVEALVGGRVEEASALLVNAYLHGHNLASLFDEVLSRAMHHVGELWYEGKLTVAQEHVATRTVLSAIQRLRGVIDVAEENGLLAICCGGEDDFHELSVQCTQVLLDSEGWRVLNLGPNTPFFALTEATMRSRPRVVCVSATILYHLDRAVREYKEFREVAQRTGTAIVLGGAGLSEDSTRKRFPADLHADTFQQLMEFVIALTSAAQEVQADAT